MRGGVVRGVWGSSFILDSAVAAADLRRKKIGGRTIILSTTKTPFVDGGGVRGGNFRAPNIKLNQSI